MISGSARAMMRHTQERAMQHLCTIEHYIVAEDGTISYGAPLQGIPCGFDLTSGSENQGASYDSITAIAKLRLPLGISVGMNDRVTITAAFGQAVTSRVFQVTSLPDNFGPSGQVVGLTEVYS